MTGIVCGSVAGLFPLVVTVETGAPPASSIEEVAFSAFIGFLLGFLTTFIPSTVPNDP
jgi:hypothetical protein